MFLQFSTCSIDCNGWVESLHVKYALPTAGIYSPILVAKPETTVIVEALYKACGFPLKDYSTIARGRAHARVRSYDVASVPTLVGAFPGLFLLFRLLL